MRQKEASYQHVASPHVRAALGGSKGHAPETPEQKRLLEFLSVLWPALPADTALPPAETAASVVRPDVVLYTQVGFYH
jgi:hypothetical protein